MKAKGIETIEQCPWIGYLEIDEDLNRKLREDTPDEIKKAYQAHQKEMQGYIDRGETIPQ